LAPPPCFGARLRCLGHSRAPLSNRLCNAMILRLPEPAPRLEHRASSTTTHRRTDPSRRTREAWRRQIQRVTTRRPMMSSAIPETRAWEQHLACSAVFRIVERKCRRMLQAWAAGLTRGHWGRKTAPAPCWLLLRVWNKGGDWPPLSGPPRMLV
jgi:hypothetical protein